MLGRGVTLGLTRTRALIVARAVLRNICIDNHDELPIESPREFIDVDDDGDIEDDEQGIQE